MSRRPKVKYTGVLAKPMVTVLGQFEDLRAVSERVCALYEHYMIDPIDRDADRKLAFALARDHVPGFEMVAVAPRGRGRTKELPIDRELLFYLDVRRLMLKTKSISGACRILANRKPYKGTSPKGLRSRYKRACANNPLVTAFERRRETIDPNEEVIKSWFEKTSQLDRK